MPNKLLKRWINDPSGTAMPVARSRRKPCCARTPRFVPLVPRVEPLEVRLLPTGLFPYTGAVQEYIVPQTGTYQIDVAGAQGGATPSWPVMASQTKRVAPAL